MFHTETTSIKITRFAFTKKKKKKKKKKKCFFIFRYTVVNKISFKALVYTLCEDKSPGCAIPSLIFRYQRVCSRVCIYDVGCFVDVLASRSG